MRRSHLTAGIFLALALISIANLAAAATLTKPVLTSPENRENINDNTPLFEWTVYSDADNYRLVIDNDPNFADGDNTYDNENCGTGGSVTIENELLDGVYYWKVAAENSETGEENWSENTWMFRVDTVAPSAPTLTSPDNNNRTNDNKPNLKWSTVSDISQPVLYYVAVSDNSQFPYENENSGWIASENWVTPELSDDNWYWHVRARDNAGNQSDNSSWRKLFVDKLMPEPISPADGVNTQDNTPTFEWENAVVADNYEIWIDNDSDFSSPVSGYPDNSPVDNYTPATGLGDNLYYWRARCYKGAEVSIFSPTRTLRVDTVAPSAPSPTSPGANENMNDNTPTLNWSSVSDDSTPVLYRAAVSDNSQFPYENYNSSWISGTSWTTPALSEGTWYWRVRAKDNAGNTGDNSTTRSFLVDISAPSISGITETNVTKENATIQWTTDEPATSVVEYGTTASYGSTSSDTSLVTSHSILLSGLSANTTYHYRVKSTDAANNTSTSTDQTFTTPALVAPTSSVNTISPYWKTSTSFTVDATASDTDGTVENVTLYYRYRENSGASWGSWTSFGVDTASPWRWTFDSPENDGLYEFYTRATDDDAQTEAAPSTADEDAGFDTVAPTLSSVQINGENTVTTSVSVTITIGAQDETSGLDKVRFSNDNQTWTDWDSFDNNKDYTLPLPDGSKTVYVQVKDAAGLTSSVLENSILLENATFTELVGSITENENRLADFSDWGLAVKGVRLYAKENISGAKVDLRILEGKPAEITVKGPGTVSYYFKVETNAPAENLAKVEFEFDVRKSWLENNGFKANDVKLWELDNTWKEVPVAITGENTSHVHFSASVQGLSWFAVAGEKPPGAVSYWAVVGGVIIVVVLIAIMWWWKKTGTFRRYPMRRL